jgi:hypothetical protein
VAVLLVQWARHDERSARRDDRRADHDGDADLQAYNAMLRRLAVGNRPPVAESDCLPGHTNEVAQGAAVDVDRPTDPADGDVAAAQSVDRGPERAS